MNLPFIDPQPVFENYTGPWDDLYVDEGHYSVKGNDLFASTIAQALIDIANGAGHLPVYLDLDALVSTCFGDIDADGTVGVTDFLELLAHWGPCGVRA